jgi:FkbM family methyltransferase
VFETAELRFVELFLHPGMIIFDLGAHHGVFTLLASLRVSDSGAVFAFEPSPRERARLERHLRLNRRTNVQVERSALGACQGQADLFVVEGAEDYCNSLRPPIVASKTKRITVPIQCLDDYVAKAGLPRIDFIKVDVEGAELDVLKGSSTLLSKRPRPVLMVEVYDIRTLPWGYYSREIIRLLRGLNFSWFRLDTTGNPRPIDSETDPLDANLIAVPDEKLEAFRQRFATLGGNV